ncbi:MAG: hypothetical protein IJE29_03620 [Firmicutes bacterium]|nr:hypothetical protein [Bacillota bacterium]
MAEIGQENGSNEVQNHNGILQGNEMLIGTLCKIESQDERGTKSQRVFARKTDVGLYLM